MSKLATLAALAIGMQSAAADAKGKPFIPSGLLAGLETAAQFAVGVGDAIAELTTVTAEAVASLDAATAGKLTGAVTELREAAQLAASQVQTELDALRGEVKRANDDTALILAELEALRERVTALEPEPEPEAGAEAQG